MSRKPFPQRLLLTHDGFIACHEAMRRKLPEWPKTLLGHPCTAGTTASIAIIRGNILYVAYVGDSGIVMGYEKSEPNSDTVSGSVGPNTKNVEVHHQMPSHMTFSKRSEGSVYPLATNGGRLTTADNLDGGDSDSSPNKLWYRELTTDHKPEAVVEKRRIVASGGDVAIKNGVHRVIWNRPRLNTHNLVHRNDGRTTDRVPFLAVARSLGDLWSYNKNTNEFAVSPVPDIEAFDLTTKNEKPKFLIVASDGIWNMIRPWDACHLVSTFNARQNMGRTSGSPAHDIVRESLHRWRLRGLRADNSTAVVVWLDRAPGVLSKNFVNRVWSSDSKNVNIPHLDQLKTNQVDDDMNSTPTEIERMNSTTTDPGVNLNAKPITEHNTSMTDGSALIGATESAASSSSADSSQPASDSSKKAPVFSITNVENSPQIFDDEDDNDTTFDFSMTDDIMPAKYPSERRMKRFADLSIPTSELGLISDDESDDEDQVSESSNKNLESDPTKTPPHAGINRETTDFTVTPIPKALLAKKESSDSPCSFKHEAMTDEPKTERITSEPIGPNTGSSSSTSSKQTKSKLSSGNDKEVETNVSQNVTYPDDPNMPIIQINTQTKNTGTSVITTTTTTIVTRKRSSSESNNSKSSGASSHNSDCSGHSNTAAKKRKKSNEMHEGCIEEENEQNLGELGGRNF